MSEVKNYSYVGRGLLMVRPFGSADPLMALGNASALKLSISESKIEQKNYMTVGGGTRDVLSRVDSAELEVTLYDLSPLTLAMALRATHSEITPEMVTDEEITFAAFDTFVDLANFASMGSIVVKSNDGATTYTEGTDYDVTYKSVSALDGGAIGSTDTVKVSYIQLQEQTVTATTGLLELENLPDAGSMVVTNNDGSTVYTRGTDYHADSAGLELIEGGAITNGASIKVHYAVLPSVQLEALTATGVEFYALFKGMNEARTNAPMNIRINRIKFSPTDGLDLISDEYGQITLKGSILADSSRPVGQSQYFSATMATIQ